MRDKGRTKLRSSRSDLQVFSDLLSTYLDTPWINIAAYAYYMHIGTVPQYVPIHDSICQVASGPIMRGKGKTMRKRNRDETRGVSGRKSGSLCSSMSAVRAEQRDSTAGSGICEEGRGTR